MRSVQLKTIGLSVVPVLVLSLWMVSPGAVIAGQAKKDVCHMEGTGDYHVISIAEPAWQTHYDHGDGDADGGNVPGMEGYVFAADCTLLEALPPCPCDFSLDAYLALEVDPTVECVRDTPGNALRAGDPIGFNDMAVFDAYGCVTHDDSLIIEGVPLTMQAEFDACRTAILAIVAELNIQPCN